MKIAILGGGITGLTAAYSLANETNEVVVFEKAKVLGGLASGFVENSWKWPLERAYHHIFSNDTDIINLMKETGFEDFFLKKPRTDSLYKNSLGEYEIVPIDTIVGFLKFPHLALFEKIRAGVVILFLKLSPFLSLYERYTAEHFIKKTMGDRVWGVLFQELFRKKFGKYAGNILASFIWARINKRTPKLGYMKGGFQTLIDHLEKVCLEKNVKIIKEVEVPEIKKNEGVFELLGEKYDVVVSTLPSPILIKVAERLLSSQELDRLSQLKYLHALVLIIESEKPILNDTYWLNVSEKDIPLMVLVQHTNFIDKTHYSNNHIAYIGYYLERDDALMSKTKEELIDFLLPHLKKINNSDYTIKNTYLFKGPFAQPVFDELFIKNKPGFHTSVENFYIANLDMTYPYDRGTNYAVKLGKDVASIILNKNRSK